MRLCHISYVLLCKYFIPIHENTIANTTGRSYILTKLFLYFLWLYIIPIHENNSGNTTTIRKRTSSSIQASISSSLLSVTPASFWILSASLCSFSSRAISSWIACSRSYNIISILRLLHYMRTQLNVRN